MKPLKSLKNPLVVFWRFSKSRTHQHFYTTRLAEADNAVGYVREDSPGKVMRSATDCSCEDSFIPIYRRYNPFIVTDQFYTANKKEAKERTGPHDYMAYDIAFYCSPTKGLCGATRPLHRYLLGPDHFYTSSLNEGNKLMKQWILTGRYKGILCYIWP